MSNSFLVKPDHSWVKIFARFAERIDINWIGQSDPRYDEARLIYNRYHDLHPFALVQTQSPAKIADVIRFSINHNITLAIRGGGHHIAGYGSCEGGIVIDFSPFRRVIMNPDTGIVEVDPGARLRDMDRELCPRGAVVPTGTVSETGVAGLTLGGGIGWLVGLYGLTCDHLIGADIVLADGRQVRAEDLHHQDLLWALRGGGGNFGVVTRFRYKALPLPRCITGSAIVSIQNAPTALESLLDFLGRYCPRHLTVAPIFTRSVSGEPILSIDFCLASSDETILRALSKAISPADWTIRYDRDFIAWQSTFDTLFQPPMRGYWKSQCLKNITKADIEILIEAFLSAPIHRSAILIEHLHGAFLDTGIETSAFPLRWARFNVLFTARWPTPTEDDIAINWVRRSFARLDPSNTSAAYSNYTGADDHRAISAFDDSVPARVSHVKNMYDPKNVFRRNHNFGHV